MVTMTVRVWKGVLILLVISFLLLTLIVDGMISILLLPQTREGLSFCHIPTSVARVARIGCDVKVGGGWGCHAGHWPCG